MNTKNLTIRRSNERGYADHGWLKAQFSFSFADYYAPEHMGFKSLRVINEDRISARKGFGRHPHNDMEIFTYIISGELKHEDSMGNVRTIKSGEFQYMSAGSGISHSEVNPTDDETHLLQIWIQPNQYGGSPKYAELDTERLSSNKGITLFASGTGKDGSIKMRQNAEIYFGKLATGENVSTPESSLSNLWLHIIKGQLTHNGIKLKSGDAFSSEDHSTSLSLTADQDSEFLIFLLN